MESRLTYGELDQVVDHVNFKDQVARFPQAPVPNPDSFNGRALAAAEKARQQRRREMDEKNARLRAEAQAAAAEAQADADEARHQLGRLTSKIQTRNAERRDVDAKASALYAKDREKHRAFDALVTDLQARAAALPPTKG